MLPLAAFVFCADFFCRGGGKDLLGFLRKWCVVRGVLWSASGEKCGKRG